MFVIFHIILAGLLLVPLACYLYTFSSLLATAVLVGLVRAGVLPEQPLLLQSSLFPNLLLAQQSLKEVALVFLFFGAAGPDHRVPHHDGPGKPVEQRTGSAPGFQRSGRQQCQVDRSL